MDQINKIFPVYRHHESKNTGMLRKTNRGRMVCDEKAINQTKQNRKK